MTLDWTVGSESGMAFLKNRCSLLSKSLEFGPSKRVEMMTTI